MNPWLGKPSRMALSWKSMMPSIPKSLKQFAVKQERWHSIPGREIAIMPDAIRCISKVSMLTVTFIL
jgi:hypothetical protein